MKFYNIFVILFTGLTVNAQTIADSWAGGDGTENNPYQINDISQLRKLAHDVNNGISFKDKYFILTSDIRDNDKVLNEDGTLISDYEKLRSITMIGAHEETPFRGNFDGANHTIFGLYGSQSDLKVNHMAKALFGCVSGTIQNIRVKDSYYGSLVFTVIPNGIGKIYNCINYSTTNAGIIEGASDNAKVDVINCGNYGHCTDAGIGGIRYSTSKIETYLNCYNYGTIINDGISPNAGIAVFATNAINCVNYGPIDGTSGAGIIRSLEGNSGKRAISNVINIGKITPFPNDLNGAIFCYADKHYDNRAQVSNVYYWEASATQMRGNNNDYRYYSLSGDNLKMTEDEMKSQEFLDKLNYNASGIGEECCMWKFGKDGFPTLEIVDETEDSGVDTIFEGNDCNEIDNSIYYNLQGIRINNPSKGIYIKKQGQKMCKVLIN